MRLFLFLLVATQLALGGEDIKVIDQYSLVGIIANDKEAKTHRGIAVIKDVKSLRSLTIGVGDRLPYSQIRVEAIKRDHVELSDGRDRFELRYIDLEPVTTAAAVSPEFSERREESKGAFDESFVPSVQVAAPSLPSDIPAVDEEVLYEHAQNLLEEIRQQRENGQPPQEATIAP